MASAPFGAAIGAGPKGKDAANALAEWIGRRPVTCEELDRDRYDRMVARCSVAGEDLARMTLQELRAAR